MFCINCGRQAEEGVRFCPYCGTKLTDAAGTAPLNPDPRSSAAPRSGTGETEAPAAVPRGSYPPPTAKNDAAPCDLKRQKPGPSFDPWSVGGVSGETGGPQPGGSAPQSGGSSPYSGEGSPYAGVDRDPWAGGSGVAAAVKPRPGKKHTVRNVILIVLGVVVLALVGLYLLGSALADYEPVIESYFAYAEEGSVPRVETLFHPEVYDFYVEHYGRAEAIEHADNWTKHYGKEVERFDISSAESQSDSLADFNDTFGLQAEDYRDVTVNVYYADDTYCCIDFDMVLVEDAWYLVDTW